MEVIEQKIWSKQKGARKEVIQVHTEGYYTVEIKSKTLNQESDHKYNSDYDYFHKEHNKH